MHKLPFSDSAKAWDKSRPLTTEELRYWISIHRPPLYLDSLIPHEENRHVWVPLVNDERSPALPFIAIAREVHQQGYRRYFPHPERLPLDAAERRILALDTDATQRPGIRGIALMCYSKQGIESEYDIYGLIYELASPKDESGVAIGWRALPIRKLFLPVDRPSPLSQWGLDRLDELEQSGAAILELSGISVRPTVPNPGRVFHEIMRRLVHQAIIVQAYGRPKKVFAFAMVETVRDRVRIRMGVDNFIPLGKSFLPPGKDVDDHVRLAPHIIEPYHFFDRLVTSYRKTPATDPSLKSLTSGILHYTQGLPWQYISQYPAMIELLAELDRTAQSSEPRDASTGWHDRCESNMECHVCYPPVTVFDHIQIPHYREYLF